jgi:hypothetical protein
MDGRRTDDGRKAITKLSSPCHFVTGELKKTYNLYFLHSSTGKLKMERYAKDN